MNYDFLREYHIPTTANHTNEEIERIDQIQSYGYNSLQQPPPPPSALLGCFGTEDYQMAAPAEIEQTYQGVNFSHQNQKNRYVAPKYHGTNFKPKPPHSRPLKRKFPGASVPEKIAEVTPDGKLAIFQGRDESYPDELNKLIHPLNCDLCKNQMNSLHSAKDHYESKTHDRNITIWLTKEFTEKGLNPPAVKRFAKQGGPTGPEAFHCELCDLMLTSATHAQQHFTGRKHRLVASKVSKPSGSGFYNNEGKWVRTGTKFTPTVDNDGRFGIGEQFKHEDMMETDTAPDTTTTITGEELAAVVAVAAPEPKKQTIIKVTSVPPLPPPPPPPIATEAIGTEPSSIQIGSLFCKVCNIGVTSPAQMTTHLEGAKHRKKLKMSGVVEPVPPPQAVSAPKTAGDSILATINENPENEDLSMYRTPTGSYYCKTCNMSMCHVIALQQHLLGKKHIKKSNDEKEKAKINKTPIKK